MARLKKDYCSIELKDKQLFYYSGLPDKQQRPTSSGLTVQVRIVAKQYQKALPSKPELINKNRISQAAILPQFSYMILP